MWEHMQDTRRFLHTFLQQAGSQLAVTTAEELGINDSDEDGKREATKVKRKRKEEGKEKRK